MIIIKFDKLLRRFKNRRIYVIAMTDKLKILKFISYHLAVNTIEKLCFETSKHNPKYLQEFS